MQYSKNKDKKKQKKAAAAAAEPPAKKEKPRYQKNEPERATNDEDHADVDEFDTDEPNPNKADGMADMMAKILGQNVGDKNPVLAKRKTAQMKDIEADRVETLKIKKQRVERRAEQTKQLVIPDVVTADYERQLKKLATRGVVALFNAIATAKREASEETNAKEISKKEAKKVADKANPTKMTPKQLKESLKTGNKSAGGDADEDTLFGGADRKTAAVANKKVLSSSTTVNASRDSEEKKAVNWKALKDDYLMDKPVNMKNWDQMDSDDDDGNEGEESD